MTDDHNAIPLSYPIAIVFLVMTVFSIRADSGRFAVPILCLLYKNHKLYNFYSLFSMTDDNSIDNILLSDYKFQQTYQVLQHFSSPILHHLSPHLCRNTTRNLFEQTIQLLLKYKKSM